MSNGDGRQSGGGSNSQTNVPASQYNVTPRPPPFNPLPSYHGHNPLGSSLGQSVVPDLMRVYESLTQSSTPQHPQPQQQHQQEQQQQQQQSQQHQHVQGPQHQQHVQVQHQQQPQNSQPQYYQPQSHSTQQQQQPPAQQQYQPQQFINQYPAPQPPPQQHQLSVMQPSQQPQMFHQQYSQSGQQYLTPQQHYLQHQPHDSTYGQQLIHSSHTPPPSDLNTNLQHQTSSPTGSYSDSAQSTSGRSTRKRRGSDADSESGSQRNRKKSSQSDGRWSKRFTWPDELHRDFVAAVFDVGLKHSSPSAILENMPKHEDITSERIKSHLQKYRLHRAKSKKEFMASYDTALAKFKGRGGMPDPLNKKGKSLSSGEVAAHLSYSTMVESSDPSSDPSQLAAASFEDGKGGALFLPQLTELEKQSPLGASMGYLMGLFFSLRQQLMHQRANQGQQIPSSIPPASSNASAPPNNVPNSSGDQYASSNHGSTGAQCPSNAVLSVYSSFSGGPNPGQYQQQEHQTTNDPHRQPQHQWSGSSGNNVPASTEGQQQQTYGGASSSSQPQSESQENINQRQQHPADTKQPPPPTPTTQSKILISPLSTEAGRHPGLEESQRMKLEMKNQMAVQNKMRALKQQELNKYKNFVSPGSQQPANLHTKDGLSHSGKESDEKADPSAEGPSETPDPVKSIPKEKGANTTNDAEAEESRGQGAGEAAGASSSSPSSPAKSRSMSGSDDFWNTDVVDDQLFEFLMS